MKKPTYICSTCRNVLAKHIGVYSHKTGRREPICAVRHEYPMVVTTKRLKICTHCAAINKEWPVRKRLARVFNLRYRGT